MRLYVTDRGLYITEDETLVAGSVREYTVIFAFSPAWEDYEKTAVFQAQTGELYEVALTDDACLIPWQVLAEPQYIKIGIRGTKGAQVRPTLWYEKKFVEPGAENAEPNPQKESWEAIQAALEQMDEDLTASETARDAASDEADRAETAAGRAEDAAEDAAETLASIPEDYSALSADVGGLKSAIDTLTNYRDCFNGYTHLSPDADFAYEDPNLYAVLFNAKEAYYIFKCTGNMNRFILCGVNDDNTSTELFRYTNGSVPNPAEYTYHNTTYNRLYLVVYYGSLSPNVKTIIIESPTETLPDKFTVNGISVSTETELKTLKGITTTVVSDETAAELANNDGYLLGTDGTVSSYQTGWWVTDLTDISAYESLIVSGASGYNHLVYAFYKSDETFISGLNSGADLKTITNESVTIPSNAKYIRISGIYPTQTPVLVGVSNSRTVNSANAEKWKGKKWVCIGDSLTETNNTATIKYYNCIASETGITAVDFGKSGTGYANPGSTTNFVSRMANVPTDADVYTIFGSFNDYEYSVEESIPIGDADDTGTTSLCGYMNSAISALVTRVPLANIGIVAPCPWVSVNEYDGSGNGFGANYVAALKAVAARWSIPFLNLYEESGLRPWDDDFVALAYTKDALNGVHPDETGHKILSTKFKAFLESLLP